MPTKRASRGARSRAQVERVRADVYARDGHRCLVSASPWARIDPCSGALTIQHAIGKGMGGSTLFDGAEYLRTMCWHHNELQPKDAIFADLCLRMGWAIERNRKPMLEPATLPVRYPDGRDYYLDGAFGRELALPSTAAEFRAVMFDPVLP